MLAVNDLASHVVMESACRAFAFNPGYVYRDRARRRGVFSRHPITVRSRPPLAFSIAEQNRLLGVLDSERFAERGVELGYLEVEGFGQKWTCFHLHGVIDNFSRYVVGWMIAYRESAELAEQFIADTVDKQEIDAAPFHLRKARRRPLSC